MLLYVGHMGWMPLYVGHMGWAYVCPFIVCGPKFVCPLHTYIIVGLSLFFYVYLHIVCYGFHRYAFVCGTNNMKWDGMAAHSLMEMETFFVFFFLFTLNKPIKSFRILVHRSRTFMWDN